MSSKSMGWGSLAVVAGLLVGGAAFITGCQKSQPAARQSTPAAAAAVEQTTCPVMGGAIDKNIFVEYKGKKVYFCCKGCVETFKANPEKYLAKLPQFAEPQNAGVSQ